MEFRELKQITADTHCEVSGKEWEIHCGTLGDGFYIQLRYLEPDVITGDPQDQHGRKWYVSSHSTKSEVVQTILKACLTSAEHMVREHFRYRGVQIFGPHFHVETLVGLAKVESRDVRRPMEKKEKA